MLGDSIDALQLDRIEAGGRIGAGPVARRDDQAVEETSVITAGGSIDRSESEGRPRERRCFAAGEQCELFVECGVAELGPGMDVGETVIDSDQRAVAWSLGSDGAEPAFRFQLVFPVVNQEPLRRRRGFRRSIPARRPAPGSD